VLMRRFSAWLVGPLMLAAVVAAAAPAGAATARPDVGVNRVAGQYTAYGKWDKKGYTPFSLTLNRDGTGTDLYGDTIIWTISGKDLQMTFDGGLWTYLGTKSRAGFDNAKHPGTLSNINGGTGTWYAVKIS
jgi:hypothetical protein